MSQRPTGFEKQIDAAKQSPFQMGSGNSPFGQMGQQKKGLNIIPTPQAALFNNPLSNKPTEIKNSSGGIFMNPAANLGNSYTQPNISNIFSNINAPKSTSPASTYPFNTKPNPTNNSFATNSGNNSNPFAHFQNSTNTGQNQSNIFNQGGNNAQTQQSANQFSSMFNFGKGNQPSNQTGASVSVNNIFNNNTVQQPTTNKPNLFGQPNWAVNNQQPPNVFAQTNNFNQNSQTFQNNFPQNINPQNMSLADSFANYTQQYVNYVSTRPPFQNQQHNQPQWNEQHNNWVQPHPQLQFNPQQQNGQYYMFLNNLTASDPIKKASTNRQLFQFAEGWANKIKQPPAQHQYISQEEQAREEVKKLFEYKVDPAHLEMKMRDLPPIQITADLLERMNDPYSCKLILTELWLRAKESVEEVVKSLDLPASGKSTIKVKDLPFHKQMAVVWKELKILEERVEEMSKREIELDRLRQQFCLKMGGICQVYKQGLVEVGRNTKLLEDANIQIEMVSEYIQRSLRHTFRSYSMNQPTSFQDPDPFVLEVATYILNRMTVLQKNISDHMALNDTSCEGVTFLELAENLCLFYEEIAVKLYEVTEKIKMCVRLGSRLRAYGNNEEIMKRIEGKAGQVVSKKLQFYYQLKEIQNILQKRGCYKTGVQDMLKSSSPKRYPANSNQLEFLPQHSRYSDMISQYQNGTTRHKVFEMDRKGLLEVEEIVRIKQ